MDAPTRLRAGKFIRLLSSDIDGEVVAAARALGRAVDLHALATLVEGLHAAPPPVQEAPTPYSDLMAPNCEVYHLEMVLWVTAHLEHRHRHGEKAYWTDGERRFCGQRRHRALTGEPPGNIFPTYKTCKWWGDILLRAGVINEHKHGRIVRGELTP